MGLINGYTKKRVQCRELGKKFNNIPPAGEWLFSLPSFVISVVKFYKNVSIYIINVDINMTCMCQMPAF